MNTPPEKKIMGNESDNISDGQVLEGNKAAAHGKLKSRHLYMIAMGGKLQVFALYPRANRS